MARSAEPGPAGSPGAVAAFWAVGSWGAMFGVGLLSMRRQARKARALTWPYTPIFGVEVTVGAGAAR